jgi:glycosyltransferase involved in cell wall biosynthesis
MNNYSIGGKKAFVVACIPAYNEELTIAKVVLRARRHVDRVIVCDDGSTDMTAELAEACGAELIRHERNMGYGAAIGSLFRKAREIGADIMVTLDADGQHDPDDIPRLIEPILNGEADIVIGSRFLADEREIPMYRKVGIRIINYVMRMKIGRLSDTQSGFRAYSKRALEVLKPTENGMAVSTEILLKAEEFGLSIREVPVKILYNVEKSSKMNPIIHGLDVILGTIKHMSIKHPLMFYGIPGVISLLVALISGSMLIYLFNMTRYFSIPLALITMGFGLLGTVLLLTAVMLWIIVGVMKENK